MLFDQTSRKILVIGATGGIGHAIASILLEHGHTVFLPCRDPESDKATALHALAGKYGDRASILELDICDQSSIEGAMLTLQEKVKHLHLVINCSGLLHDGDMQPEKRLEDMEQENLLRSFAVNTIGPALLVRHALPLLRHNETSIIANLSARVGSISDNRIGGWYGYRASKAAQNMVTKTAAIELQRRSKNTIIVGLHPGTVDTGLSKPFQSSVKPGQLKTPRESAQHLLDVVNNLKPDDSGKVFAWDGKEILP